MQICLLLSSSIFWHPLISDHSKYSLATLILVFLLFWRECCWLNEFAPVIHSQYLMNGTDYESCCNPELFPRSWFFFWRNSPQWAMASSFTRFLYHTQRRTTVSRAPLDEWLARRRDVYLTIHQDSRQTSMPPGGIRTHCLSRRAAVDLRLRPLGHRYRRSCCISTQEIKNKMPY